MINLIGKKAQIACELLCCCSMAYAQSNDNSEVVVLNTGWEFSQAGTELWRPAQVPGTVHQDLINHKQLPDPFYGINEQKIQWVENEDWEYRTAFTVTPEQLKRDDAQLVFEGLDTYADVYLNGALLLKADNMFVGYTIPVKSQLRIGENLLHIYFHSPIRQTLPQYNSNGFNYPADNDHHDKHLSIFSRKAPYSYGWDWGIRMVTSGIWRPVTIRFYDAASISDYHVKQLALTDQLANLSNELEINNILPRPLQAEVRINTSFEGSAEKSISQAITLQPGINHVSIPSEVASPVRWMPNGWGKPALYDFSAQIIVEDKVVAEQSHRIGLRTVRLVNEKDKDGESFYFEVNGVPMFAKGANYIPSDNFLPRVTPENYKRTILDAAGVNMNMLRVWGGGIYENDVFYDLCDEHGIMIWQDFMFACSMYPAEGALLDNIHQEAVDNVKRLRNHACIALWCGNNECQDAWLGWGWKCEIERQNKEYADKIWAQYRQQYHVTLPGVVREYAPGTFYWPSSPFAFEGEMSGTTDGDRHYWSVWHGKAPISDYDSEKSRFFSEYGFQSFPEFDSVKRYAPYPEDWDIRSEVMMSHQRGGDHANGLIETYLLNEYKKPRDFRAFLYMNHVLQGDAIKTAIESHRRQMPYNMGTLFWQHNDCWPVASWASRDYYGRWKAQHYYTRKVYDDILISPVVEGDDLKVYAVSDRLENTSGRLQLQVCRFDGTVVYHWDKSVGISGNDSRVCFSAPLAKLLEGADRGTVYVRVDYTDKSGRVYHNNYCLDKQKNMNYPKVDLQTEVRSIEGGYEVTVSTDKFARAVCLSVADNESVYSDNYFDVQPKSSVQVQVRTRLSAEAFNASLRLTCLNNEF